ncbi:MAG: 50S ribosomal protein L10 [Phycisphaerales bacterium JB063]
MSKPIKNLITKAYAKRFEGVTGAVLLDIRGVEANDNNTLRNELAAKHIKITVVKNSLARKAFEGTDLEGLNGMIQGPSAMAFAVSDDISVVNVARELIDWAKKLEHLEFRGAILDGIQFGPDEIKKLSDYPTKEEAQAKVVTMLLSPGRNLVGAIKSPAGNIAGILKTIQEKLEAGETIAKAS